MRHRGPVLVQLERVSKVYRMGDVEVHALHELDLTVHRGELVVILGPSGSGKTTILNMIGGMDSPSTGRVIVDGVDIASFGDAALTAYRRTHVGFVFQFFNRRARTWSSPPSWWRIHATSMGSWTPSA
jgi:putative ABC transport system ATP-binding protein